MAHNDNYTSWHLTGDSTPTDADYRPNVQDIDEELDAIEADELAELEAEHRAEMEMEAAEERWYEERGWEVYHERW